jgi:hypothetical protein
MPLESGSPLDWLRFSQEEYLEVLRYAEAVVTWTEGLLV